MSAVTDWLTTSPLLGLASTLAVYWVAQRLWLKAGMTPLLHPVLISIAVLGGGLLAAGIPYADYFKGAQVLHMLLGPATVALAIPLYRQLAALKRSVGAIGVALILGSVTAILSASKTASWLGAAPNVALSLAPKSVTSPIALGISDQIGGISSLTAALVVVTGLLGAAFGPWALDRLGIKSHRARGLAMGVAAHGIGTARALQANEEEGAFAGMGMALNGLATAILIPLLLKYLF